MFYNTTKESGKDLESYSVKAETQKESVLFLFQKFKKGTASDVWAFYGPALCPLTSIRRAITDLCNEGKLIRTEEKKIGLYGRSEFIYSLKPLEK